MWSPDSTRVLYEDEDDEHRLWVVNADGSGKRQLSTSSFFEEWSPDGARILYNDRDGLWVVNADGSGKQQLSTRGRDTAWSPDGARILYSDFDRGGLWLSTPTVPASSNSPPPGGSKPGTDPHRGRPTAPRSSTPTSFAVRISVLTRCGLSTPTAPTRNN